MAKIDIIEYPEFIEVYPFSGFDKKNVSRAGFSSPAWPPWEGPYTSEGAFDGREWSTELVPDFGFGVNEHEYTGGPEGFSGYWIDNVPNLYASRIYRSEGTYIVEESVLWYELGGLPDATYDRGAIVFDGIANEVLAAPHDPGTFLTADLVRGFHTYSDPLEIWTPEDFSTANGPGSAFAANPSIEQLMIPAAGQYRNDDDPFGSDSEPGGSLDYMWKVPLRDSFLSNLRPGRTVGIRFRLFGPQPTGFNIFFIQFFEDDYALDYLSNPTRENLYWAAGDVPRLRLYRAQNQDISADVNLPLSIDARLGRADERPLFHAARRTRNRFR